MLGWLVACATEWETGDFVVTRRDDGLLDIATLDGKALVNGLRFGVGDGDETYEMAVGSYRQVDGETRWVDLVAGRPAQLAGVWPLEADDGTRLADVRFSAVAADQLVVQLAGRAGNRVRWDAACTGDDHFAGLGEHAFDVDHAGSAFDLWVSEPGIGKTTTDAEPDSWFLTGARHQTSFPDPFLLRPEPLGLVVDSSVRLSVDLCTGDRWRVAAFHDTVTLVLLTGDTPLDVVAAHARMYGDPVLPPEWAFAPWNDAVGGVERVEAVAATLRAAGAPSSVIWTEDWKGAEETELGYHLLPEWEVDDELYPDASATDAALEALGFKWFAYFSPFVAEDSGAWEEAREYVIRQADGSPYLFEGVTFEPTTVLDFTRAGAAEWAQGKMAAAVAVGFDGWMADYAEWLPTDAQLASGDAEDLHNAWPLYWQDLNADALADQDATFFARSGWSGSGAIAPVHWPGDQRTSFDADDGLPTAVPLMLGDSVAGAVLTGSDIGGYQSVGNDPSTRELWFRWCELGAFSPVMRTHHGAFAAENWQFDTDAETVQHFARYAREHVALYPYLRGLAADAADEGTPIMQPIFLQFPEERWDRVDAYMLGPSLFVAPVVAAGRRALDVALPAGSGWYDWWAGTPATGGEVAAPLDEIPVFARSGAVIPLFDVIPDTLVDGPLDGLLTRSDADLSRTVRVYCGRDGSFTEADGTSYRAAGSCTGTGTTRGEMASGMLTAAGITLTIEGETARSYTLEVVGG
jgi:alpha-glucosidase (family GH31 glycosyl hydrolase)